MTVQHIEPTSEDEMVAIFLRTEITSTRFAQDILAILVRDGQPRTIVEQPNLADQPTEQLILASYTVL
jgi:hypothetical protein